jgi:hypothetical protein
LEVVRAIVAKQPGLNQTEIVEVAKQQSNIAKHKVEDALKDKCFTTKSGNGREKLYYLSDTGESDPLAALMEDRQTGLDLTALM